MKFAAKLWCSFYNLMRIWKKRKGRKTDGKRKVAGCCLQITNANEALVQASQQSYSRSWKFNLTKKFSEIMFEKYSHQKLVLKFVLYNFTQFFFHKTSKRDIPSKKTEEVTKIFFVLYSERELIFDDLPLSIHKTGKYKLTCCKTLL